MANTNCSACDDLRQVDPNLLINGLGDTECASLQNNTGLVPTSGNDDCEDLHNLNDCLVGNMATEVDAYDVCDWKTFMKKFIPNVWTTLKGIICAICGLWTNITNLWEKVNCFSTSITNFDRRSIYAEVSDYVYFYDWVNTNTPANPASPVTVTYSAMHSYVLARPGNTALSLINSIDVGQYGTHTVGGVTYNGIPVYQFTGSMTDNNLKSVYNSAHITTDGVFVYSVEKTAQSGDNITFTVALRAKLLSGTMSADNISFFWNELTLRKLDFDC